MHVGEMGKHPSFLQLGSVGTGQAAENSPGNRNGGVSTGDHAVLLFRVDPCGIHSQSGTGVNYRPRSVGNKKKND